MDPISLGIGLASTALKAAGTIAAGNDAMEGARYKDAQYRQAATESRAGAQRQSFEKKRESRLLQSRLQANAAASGGGAADGSIIKLGSEIAGRGEYLALTEMYKGENKARGYEDAGTAALMEGRAAQQGAKRSAIGTIIGGAGGLFKGLNMSAFAPTSTDTTVSADIPVAIAPVSQNNNEVDWYSGLHTPADELKRANRMRERGYG
jgi:hypothetical protein